MAQASALLVLLCHSALIPAMSWLPMTPPKDPISVKGAHVQLARIEMADRVVVKKAERQLYLMRGERILHVYAISLGFQPVGAKHREGDGRTPEGIYVLDTKNASSRFHKSIHISYPNARDRMRAAFRGERPGGMIMIHGQPNGREKTHLARGDWTLGCIAVSSPAIDEIWRLTPLGTPIEILP